MRSSSITKVKGEIPSTEGVPIRYDLLVPTVVNSSSLPVILFIHGFKGFKDWGAFPDACEELVRSGFAVIAFNLSLSGVGESLTEFDEPELFRRQTLSQDLEDVGSVIDAIKTKRISSDKVSLDTDRIGLVGHSRGGHTAIAAAAEYAEVQCLVTWSAVADYNTRWSDQMKSDWDKKGTTEIVNSRTGQILQLDKVGYDDAVNNAERLMAIRRVQELYIPSLFIAAKEDEAVSYHDTEQLFRHSPADEKEIRLIAGTGHTFGISHPFSEDEFPDSFAEVIDLTEGWFLEYLK